jgi:putative SOS response-associated peptidase YedK
MVVLERSDWSAWLEQTGNAVLLEVAKWLASNRV